jgi:hypothetical protein
VKVPVKQGNEAAIADIIFECESGVLIAAFQFAVPLTSIDEEASNTICKAGRAESVAESRRVGVWDLELLESGHQHKSHLQGQKWLLVAAWPFGTVEPLWSANSVTIQHCN